MNRISNYDLYKKITNKENIYLIDVREKSELIEGYIQNSINISLDDLKFKINSIVSDKDAQIITYCSKGIRSLTANTILNEMGYKNIFSLSEGFNKWKEENYSFIQNNSLNYMDLSENDFKRYNRQIKLKEIGVEGQKRLLDSKVLIIGAGGLGSPLAYYLASSGVGTIGIIDNDIVDISNLHRQIIHFESDLGKLKTESAKEKINKINPNINVISFNKNLDLSNSEEIIKDFDLIIDGTDNFNTKYLINDTCFKLKIPYVYGSIYKFDGQVSLFSFKENTPCYRCLFPNPPESGLAPNCSETGVLGVLPGVIGIIQATEAIKYILKIGDPLEGELLVYNALDTYFKKIKIKQSKDCICSNK